MNRELLHAAPAPPPPLHAPAAVIQLHTHYCGSAETHTRTLISAPIQPVKALRLGGGVRSSVRADGRHPKMTEQQDHSTPHQTQIGTFNTRNVGLILARHHQ